MKKIAIVAAIALAIWWLLNKRTASIGVSVPTSFPTSLYSPTLMTT